MLPSQRQTFGLGLLLAFLASCNTASAVDVAQCFYVAPEKAGDGSGGSLATAAYFRDMDFWLSVQQAVQKGPATVDFLGGRYIVSSDQKKAMPTLALADLGHKDHLLTLQGSDEEHVIFTRHPDDSRKGKTGPGFFKITRSENLLVRNFEFTAEQPIGYATHFGGNRNVVVEKCRWIDLPGVYYGATGTAGDSTDHVTFRDGVFGGTAGILGIPVGISHRRMAGMVG